MRRWEATGKTLGRWARSWPGCPRGARRAERKEKADKLLELFAKIVDAQRHANAFELVLASESALRAAFERLDVPLPPSDPDSPFALTEEAG
ncbi:hypothetical protein GCM10009850_116210 [Nonomuraea monospora]|uniref:Transposase n=1 Tax=Nonomuraea monospora TaxID=568818 RepID=A0ABN3D2T8_9ACTN